MENNTFEQEANLDAGSGGDSTDSFRSFFLESPLSYQSLGPDGRYLDVNPAWENTFGYHRDEILGRKFSDLMTAESEALVAERFPILKKQGEVRDAAFEIIHKNGQALLVTLHGRANYDKNGDFLSTNCILIDVTDKTRIEKERIRTEQLASIGELAASVAHEINNPISGVINYSQILMNQEGLSEDQRDLLTRIQNEGIRVADIVENLLNYARDSKGLKSFNDLKQLVNASLVLLNQKIRQAAVQVNFEWPEALPPVSCNPQQVEQVIINILRNACQALGGNSSKDRKILVRAEVDKNDEQSYIQLIIANNGPNIPPEILSKILQPFFTTKPTGVGTGLGLSISATIMQEHGGELVVLSPPGEMTEMVLRFPM